MGKSLMSPVRSLPLRFVFGLITAASAALVTHDLFGADNDPDFPAAVTKFVAAEKNPVFTGAGEGKWDAKIRERGWILREEETWHLWYTGYDGTLDAQMMLGYATSPDGLTWTRSPDNPIYREHWVEDMMIVKQAGTYYMFAEGRHDQAQLLTSTDRVHWKREGQLDVRYTNGKPLTPGPYGTPTAWFENGMWYLFYERMDLGVWLATSQDLKVWTNVQDEPVLPIGPGEYDKLQIALNQIVKLDGKYYALFHGTGMTERPRMWTTDIAVSTDLRHWRKYPGNPLLPTVENKSSGILIPDGKGFRLYTMHEKVQVHFPAESRR